MYTVVAIAMYMKTWLHTFIVKIAFAALLLHKYMATVEPLYNGHFGTRPFFAAI